jgi:hypothetical protein
MAKDEKGHGSDRGQNYAFGWKAMAGQSESPIRKSSSQSWEVGQKVNVGFNKGLKVTGHENTPHGGHYSLEHPNGKKYEFHPHHGLKKL